MRRIDPTLNELEPLQRVYADLRGQVWRHYGGRLDVLAGEAKLHERTVEAFMWGDTRKPHFETVFKLMVVLGMERRLLELLRCSTPITSDMARHLKASA
ncbi:MAG TPA: hypothetical protein VGE31_01940 [Candidatus Paceibacterota bacterium]